MSEDLVARKYKTIVGCVVRNLQHLRHDRVDNEPGPLDGAVWSRVAYVCGLGSHSAIALCRKFGVDPDGDGHISPEDDDE